MKTTVVLHRAWLMMTPIVAASVSTSLGSSVPERLSFETRGRTRGHEDTLSQEAAGDEGREEGGRVRGTTMPV